MAENSIGRGAGFDHDFPGQNTMDNTEIEQGTEEHIPEITEQEQNPEGSRVYDVAIVLGCGTRADSEGNMTRMGIDGKLRVMAAGLMASQGKIREIILTGGHTAGPDNPSEAEIMQNYLLKKFSDLEGFPIRIEDQAYDTSENSKLITGMLGDDFEGTILLITNDYHMLRSKRDFAHHGIKVEEMPAEKAVISMTPARYHTDGETGEQTISPDHREAFIAKYLGSCDMKKKRAIDAVLRSIMKVDPDGKFLNLLARLLRHGKVFDSEKE